MNEKDMHILEQHVISIKDPFNDTDTIIDLGGGGEGIISILRGSQVTAVDIRQDELDEIPDGPIKVIANATNLPFEDESFTAATAFFFLMYTDKNDRKKIFEEAYRVLKPNSTMYIWDVTIPKPSKTDKNILVIPLCITLNNRTINTGYGTKWESKTMNQEEIVSLAESEGFEVTNTEINNHVFSVVLRKPETN